MFHAAEKVVVQSNNALSLRLLLLLLQLLFFFFVCPCATTIGLSSHIFPTLPLALPSFLPTCPSSTQATFTTILAHYRSHCGSLEMLRLILTHFSPEHYAPFALEMALLIKQVTTPRR